MWYFKILQLAAILLLLIYYGTILIEVFSDGKVSFTDHDLDDKHIWIPFYLWFAGVKKKSNKPEKRKGKLAKPINQNKV